MVACPLTTSVITPCCGPIVAAQVQALCCPPTAMCALPDPTLTATPNPAPPHSAITLTGSVSSGSGEPSVTLWQELAGQSAYTQLAVTNANADDQFTFAVPGASVTTNRDWYVTNGSARSAVVDELVQAQVSAAGTLAANRFVTLSGTVVPAHPSARILIEERAARQWNVIGRARLSAGSAYRGRVRAQGSGRVTVRVELPGDVRNADSFSKPMSFVIGASG